MKENNQLKIEDVVVAIDIGTTKVCAIAGRKNEYDKIDIVGVGTVVSEGVSRGVVSKQVLLRPGHSRQGGPLTPQARRYSLTTAPS